ncbi:MAG: PDZ domain-containing protein [Gemmatimonadetes bacterium]|nr:PDZ domain-containing protein [Gemmatimonadota bacterium]
MRNTTVALLLAGAGAVALGATPVAAQTSIRVPSLQSFTFGSADPDRAMLGITTSAGGRRDTLGLLVESVTVGSPAERAGLEEGNRLQSINGINLKLTPEDAADDFMQGINQNRLTREMRKVKAGDEVTLEVWGGGRTRSVRVKTVAAESLAPSRSTMGTVVRRESDRAVVGIVVSPTGTRRDTAGVFVQQVTEGGPAEKAGIVEGDRIASINGVDVRVAREDAGDSRAASARVDRLQREVGKLKPGEAAELVVVSGGRSRTVKVTTERASDLHDGGFEFNLDTGNGMLREFNLPEGGRRVIIRPRVTVRTAGRISML